MEKSDYPNYKGVPAELAKMKSYAIRHDLVTESEAKHGPVSHVLNKLNEHLRSSESDLKGIEGKVKDVEKKLAAVSKNKDALDKKYQTLETEHATLKIEYDHASKQLDATEEERVQFRAKRDELWNSIRDLARRIGYALKEDITSYSAEQLTSELKGLYHKVGDEHKAVQDQPRVPELQQHIDAAKQESDGLRQEQKTLMAHNTNLEDTLGTLVGSLRHLGFDGVVDHYTSDQLAAVREFCKEVEKKYESPDREQRITGEIRDVLTQIGWTDVAPGIKTYETLTHIFGSLAKAYREAEKRPVEHNKQIAADFESARRMAVNEITDLRTQLQATEKNLADHRELYSAKVLDYHNAMNALYDERQTSQRLADDRMHLKRELDSIQSNPWREAVEKAYVRNVAGTQTPDQAKHLAHQAMYAASQKGLDAKDLTTLVNAWADDFKGPGFLNGIHDAVMLTVNSYSPKPRKSLLFIKQSPLKHILKSIKKQPKHLSHHDAALKITVA
ncbi:MAG TPA: hypothetical protein VLJ21_03410 [Candidatus Binatia bacterium]|nr:hypothetical protein [Candidatus Binatia bacterium]